jgi:hypothetical protein
VPGPARPAPAAGPHQYLVELADPGAQRLALLVEGGALAARLACPGHRPVDLGDAHRCCSRQFDGVVQSQSQRVLQVGEPVHDLVGERGPRLAEHLPQPAAGVLALGGDPAAEQDERAGRKAQPDARERDQQAGAGNGTDAQRRHADHGAAAGHHRHAGRGDRDQHAVRLLSRRGFGTQRVPERGVELTQRTAGRWGGRPGQGTFSDLTEPVLQVVESRTDTARGVRSTSCGGALRSSRLPFSIRPRTAPAARQRSRAAARSPRPGPLGLRVQRQ